MIGYQKSSKSSPAKSDSSAPVDALSFLYRWVLSFPEIAPLNSLEIQQGLEIKKFLTLLNSKEPEGKAAGSPFKPPTNPSINYTPPSSASEVLRKWVDEWLDSGRDAQGAEDPRDRNFGEAPVAKAAACEYSKRGKILLLPDPLSDSKRLAPWFVTASEMEFASKMRGMPPSGSKDDPAEQLVFFLLSDIRLKLAKCRNEKCGSYFLLKHWNRRYKRGTLCDPCKRSRSLESALKATEKERLQAKRELYELAGNRFAKQIRSSPDWYKDSKLKDSITHYLNDHIQRSVSLSAIYMRRPRKGLTGKWVAHPKNWKKIESAIRGDK
jgi:hypothetical protein